MFTIIKDVPDNVVAVSAKGQVTGEDYEAVLIPLLSERIKTHGKIRMLYLLGSEFTGFDAAAVWDDTMFGMTHMFDFEKIAVITDVDWIRNATRFFGFLLPCPFRVFANQDLAEAKSWIQA